MLTGNFWLKGLVGGFAPSSADGTEIAAKFGRSGDLIASPLNGQYGEQCARGKVFSASAAAVTLPVNAATLVSVFSLYNPVGSGMNLELIDADISTVVATTVVDSVGLYYSTPALTALGTFTTKGIVQSGIVGGAGSGVGVFYSAYTHSGTPVLKDLLGGWGAVTDGALNNVHYDFKGKTLVAPGTIVSLAMTTAAATASGVTACLSWLERPV